MTVGTSGITNNPSARKYLSQFSELLNSKKETTVCSLSAVKKTTKKPERVPLCGPVSQSGKYIKNQ